MEKIPKRVYTKPFKQEAAQLVAGRSRSYEAPQHDTYLNVKTMDGIAGATKQDWASLWTARATSYRRTQGIDHFDVGFAVVIQQPDHALASRRPPGLCGHREATASSGRTKVNSASGAAGRMRKVGRPLTDTV